MSPNLTYLEEIAQLKSDNELLRGMVALLLEAHPSIKLPLTCKGDNHVPEIRE